MALRVVQNAVMSMPCSRPAFRLSFLLGTALGCAATSAPLRADSTLEVVALRQLDFGNLVVLGNGSKQVGADGVIRAAGVATVGRTREGPAEFTLIYRPAGTAARTAVVLLTLDAPSQRSDGGTTATLSNLGSDLAGLSAIVPGAPQVLTLPPCQPPACSTTFHIGGQLSLSGGSNAVFSFPLQVTARLLAEH